MMKFKLEIDCDNTAFDDDRCGEVAKILDDLANTVMSWRWDGSIPLRDTNGNTVGRAWAEE